MDWKKDYETRCAALKADALVRYNELVALAHAAELATRRWYEWRVDGNEGKDRPTTGQIDMAQNALDDKFGYSGIPDFVAGGEHGRLPNGMAHATRSGQAGWEEERQFLTNYLQTACKVADKATLVSTHDIDTTTNYWQQHWWLLVGEGEQWYTAKVHCCWNGGCCEVGYNGPAEGLVMLERQMLFEKLK